MKESAPPADFVTRGRLAKETGTNIETVRYYEKTGLMPPPRRSESGYRLYGEDARRRLRFILRGRELGFSIAELRSLLSLVDGGDYTCGEVQEMTVAHLDSVRSKIDDLRRLEHTLAEMSAQCEGGAVPQCPVIDVLFGKAASGRSQSE
ncbi:MAG: MerR family transcriptional regulator [Alphaproteobacteria bacterium]|nr:MAG: MerR family transcriptional regulator [Alphaproteobacteria bacterium]